MRIRVEIVCSGPDCHEQRREVLRIERQELTMETLGLHLSESKALLSGVQDFVIAQQAHEYLETHRACPHCGERRASKDSGTAPVKTVFGPVKVPNPRWKRCSCRSDGAKTFRPMNTWLNGRTSPEMLYLETKWASLVPFAKTSDLLKEVLPVEDCVNPESVRHHLQDVAERLEEELGEERPLNLFDGTDEEWEQQPLPDEPITVRLDGGYVRAAHKQGWFEVIAGKSVVAFRRDEESEVPSAKCFGFVQTHDEKPGRRLWEVLKSQGMQENQQLLFLSDGGENVRRVQEYLHPFSEHLIDWFHITMRLTVLQQQTKGLQEEQPQTGAAVSKQLESVKQFLWHGNTEEALERLTGLFLELSLMQAHLATARKVADVVAEFETYIRNNRGFIPNFGERYRNGETISTAFVESTINQVVSKRLVKKKSMQWTLRGAHLLLQTRTKVLNHERDKVFRRWYPKFRPQPQEREPQRKAA
ncbi:MAG: ISKra4 family transposase [Acidobacteriaceae bacterium]|nr:ISKra4 family transposase [Acidobacteriaceae bacterium]